MVKKLNNREKTCASLATLAENTNERSDAAKLRGVFDQVEMALSSGVSRKEVLDTIRTTLGTKMSLKTFENNLHRIRKKKKTTSSFKEMPKTNEEINFGSQQLDVRPVITAPAVTATKQPISGEQTEKDQNHDNNEPRDVSKNDSWKDSMNGAEIYNKLHALGDAHSKEQKRIEKEKKYEQARLKRLGKT